MKEININIEGYNVNGICVGCLNYNRKMFYRDEVKEFYKMWAKIDVPDGLTIQVCWECLASVTSAVRFRRQILKAYNVLMEYSNKQIFLNSPNDFTKYATSRLTSSNLMHDSIILHHIKEEDGINIDIVKQEDVTNKDDQNLDIQLKGIESPKAEDITDSYFDNFLEDSHPQSSDDDIQLSKLKTKKKKRKNKGDKSKKRVKDDELPVTFVSEIDNKLDETVKRSRKLKNLPEDFVELHTMSEEEMWQVRAKDVTREEFVTLKYKCDDCLTSFNTEKLMNYHLNGKHVLKSEADVQCDVCKAYFITRDNMSCHRALHLTAYKCRVCGDVTTRKRCILKHVRTEHGAPGTACITCGKTFSSESKLSYHRGVCHKESPQCDCCGKVFASKLTLKYHLKILTPKQPEEKVHLPCKGCDKVFYSKKSYRAHVVIHNGETYPCPICGKQFQWKRNLARHTRNHRERDAGATHECRECGKTFSSRDCYNNHMRLSKRHVPEDAYIHSCNYCGKKFASKWCMVDHIDWDHLKVIKYQCSVCLKAFKTAKIMVAHMNNIHEGKKNKEPESEHLCEICGKSYKSVKRLKGHVWAMHTNRSSTKTFKCKLCPATFTWQTSIYKHMKMMHDSSKRNKQTRITTVKKQDLYPEIELTNRMEYFQQNLANNIQNMVQAQPPPLHIVQNII
ncbi:zinc finger protein 813 [Papilio machaon]|uniref:zinc finger protein 813 n=1 Tax=Papilio machaon TaxID=76193 RepID=UPI001E664DA9|nr:zinc finger protein 813 [Papilio machaon]